METSASPVQSLYVHVPFCAQKCTYCNFASGVFPRELEEGYLRALVGEIEAFDWKCRPDTVYLGGGTPVQKQCGFEDSSEQMFAYLMAACGPGADETKVRIFC